jgi:hypothetical protein
MGKQKYPNTKSLSVDGVAIRKGREHYSHDKADARQDKQRQEAEARQRVYDGLTIPARLALAKSHQGESKREVARLEKALATQKAPAVKQAPLTPAQKGAKAVKTAKAAAQVKV